MEPPDQTPPRIRKLTRTRIVLAILVALIADSAQWAIGPLAWTPVDAIIDVAAMILTGWLIGFHWLLLPTFLLEAVPIIDDFPTWTACVATVVAMRHRENRPPPSSPPPPAQPPAIEI